MTEEIGTPLELRELSAEVTAHTNLLDQGVDGRGV